MARRRWLRTLGDSAFLWPMVGLLSITILWPTAIAVVGSFRDWKPGRESPFVGLDNYREVIGSPVFREIMRNQAVLLLGVPLWVTAPLVVAVLLFDRVPGAAIFRTIFFFPSILSPVLIGMLFRGVLRPDGSLNAMLEAVGLGAVARGWITDAAMVKPVVIVVVTWYTLGFGVLLYGAALSAVSQELVEAATLDGANWLQRLRYVLLPEILPTFALNSIFSLSTVFLLFGYIHVLTQGGPGYASTTIDYDIYQNSMRYGYFGYAAAESVLLLLMLGGAIVAVFAVGRRYWG